MRRRLDPGVVRERQRVTLGWVEGVGAHCLYAPGTWGLEAIRTVSDEAGGPVNVLVTLSEAGQPGPAPFRFSDVAALGVRRISLGGSLYRAQVLNAAERVRSLLADGTF